MTEWMTEFKKYLTTSYLDEELGVVVDQLQAAVCENINLYMEKFEEEFQDYLKDFVNAVWSLLANLSQSSTHDRLVVMAMNFLTTVSMSVHHALFRGAIPQICESIVIPNVRLWDEDEELFEINYVEFIRRDMEGSDLETRRRISCKLLKGIAYNHKKLVTDSVSIQIQNLLGSFAVNPVANWKDKDCAIYLVVSLASKKAGAGAIATSASTDIVNVHSFFESVIVPELLSHDLNGFPMLKAAALKFFTFFRNHIPKEATTQLLPHLIQFLGAESNVVHSYAATCIEQLLLVQDEEGQTRYSAADISPFSIGLIINLFDALKFAESEENHYIMKCMMRVLGIADITNDIARYCIAELIPVLDRVSRKPRNPVFKHCLVESVAVLARRACEMDHSLIPIFRERIFPFIWIIAPNDARFL